MYLWRYWLNGKKKADFERSRVALEKSDLVLHLNVVRRGVKADRKLLMVNGGKEDGWRVVSQDQLYLWRYWSYGNKKNVDFEISRAVLENTIYYYTWMSFDAELELIKRGPKNSWLWMGEWTLPQWSWGWWLLLLLLLLLFCAAVDYVHSYLAK